MVAINVRFVNYKNITTTIYMELEVVACVVTDITSDNSFENIAVLVGSDP